MSTMFDAVLVANRGEIAVRIIRTLRAMGIHSVVVYTDVDRQARHVMEADEAVGIGAVSAYLDVDRIVDAAARAGAEAIHPGYGFLSENASLARRCTEAGIVFIGPPAAAIELMGDKINAKQAVAAAGVPVVPGLGQPGLTDDEIATAAQEIGLPVMLKPAAGGGGKGMRQVVHLDELAGAIAAARREAIGAFGDGTLLVERFVIRPRHVEVQVFADADGRVCSLGERECSLQRRHQKIVEEAPAVVLDDATRAAMAAAAVAAARACGYVGAGTVEFILSSDRPDQFFFMEMNTRLQVEHPVTEAVLGLDLVEWQLRVAAGEQIPWDGVGPLPEGHAVEARVYAEDPSRGFLPAAGTVRQLSEPDALPHIRVDSGLRPGSVIGTEYDPMLAKVVAWGPDRPAALARLRAALAATSILGLTTNVGFLRRLVDRPEVRAGQLDTELVDRIAGDLVQPAAPSDVVGAAALLTRLLETPPGPVVDPWDIPDGWRLAGPAPQVTRWGIGGLAFEATVHDGTIQVGEVLPGGDSAAASPPQQSAPVPARARLEAGGTQLVMEMSDQSLRYRWAAQGDAVWLERGGDAWALTRLRETIDRTGTASTGSGRLSSPMPGTVLAVHVTPGQAVAAGQPLVTVEAMKMEHAIAAPADGIVGDILVKPGESVRLDQPLVVVTPASASSGDPAAG
jgi:acetyl-CoA/propionyl-CoA carboxylase biotin carboxyl carrier protein